MQERITLEKERLVRDLRTRLVDLNERRESEEVRSPLITLYIYIYHAMIMRRFSFLVLAISTITRTCVM